MAEAHGLRLYRPKLNGSEAGGGGWGGGGVREIIYSSLSRKKYFLYNFDLSLDLRQRKPFSFITCFLFHI